MRTEILAYLTVDEESSPSMLFFDRDEALGYCDVDEDPIPLVDGREIEAEAADAARYRKLFDAGLPITFLGEDYYDKASLDAAIDAALSALPAPTKGSQS